MTIDEAIAHAREVAESNRRKVENDCVTGRTYLYPFCECIKCAEEHEQLAEWLENLKAYRELGTVKELENIVVGMTEQELYHAGYSKAENDYHAQSEKDRQSSYDCGHSNAIDDFAEKVKEYISCNYEFSDLAITEINEIAEQLKEKELQ